MYASSLSFTALCAASFAALSATAFSSAALRSAMIRSSRAFRSASAAASACRFASSRWATAVSTCGRANATARSVRTANPKSSAAGGAPPPRNRVNSSSEAPTSDVSTHAESAEFRILSLNPRAAPRLEASATLLASSKSDSALGISPAVRAALASSTSRDTLAAASAWAWAFACRSASCFAVNSSRSRTVSRPANENPTSPSPTSRNVVNFNARHVGRSGETRRNAPTGRRAGGRMRYKTTSPASTAPTQRGTAGRKGAMSPAMSNKSTSHTRPRRFFGGATGRGAAARCGAMGGGTAAWATARTPATFTPFRAAIAAADGTSGASTVSSMGEPDSWSVPDTAYFIDNRIIGSRPIHSSVWEARRDRRACSARNRAQTGTPARAARRIARWVRAWTRSLAQLARLEPSTLGPLNTLASAPPKRARPRLRRTSPPMNAASGERASTDSPKRP